MQILKKHVAAAGSALIALAVIAPSFVSAHPHSVNHGPNLLYQERGKPELSRYYQQRPERYTTVANNVVTPKYVPAVQTNVPVTQTRPLRELQPVNLYRRTPRYTPRQYTVIPAQRRPETCVHTVNRKRSTRRVGDSYNRLTTHLNYNYSPRMFDLQTSGYGRVTNDAVWNGQRWVRSYRGY